MLKSNRCSVFNIIDNSKVEYAEKARNKGHQNCIKSKKRSASRLAFFDFLPPNGRMNLG